MSDIPPYGQAGSALAAEDPLAGVKGWLLFFCIALTVLGPLITFANLVNGYNETSPLFDRFPGLRTAITADTALSALLMAFSIFAGISLWTKNRNAVKIAKAYLITFLIYTIIEIPMLLALASLPSEANELIMKGAVFIIARGVIYFGIWYSYLSRSQRVAATYGTPIKEDHIGLNISKGAGG
ncbi:MAG TPA: DUF2569 family protein [Blastocatellia bacterium]|nr:DUF2569 family protein [Blastocatellia bacterium]